MARRSPPRLPPWSLGGLRNAPTVALINFDRAHQPGDFCPICPKTAGFRSADHVDECVVIDFDALVVGDQIPAATYPLTRAALVRYAGASGDFNPIHWNQRVATGVGLPDVIAHGMLTMATASRAVTDWVGDPAAVIEYSVRFTRPVAVPDDGVGAVVEVTGFIGALDADARTARVDLVVKAAGVTVLGKPRVVVKL